MPQASDEQRALMTRWFGDISDSGPWAFLLARGYTERQGWIFKPTPAHTISEYEGECIDFLCDEWDWAL